MPYTLIGSKELTQQKILTIGFFAVCAAIISSNKLRGREFSLYSIDEHHDSEEKSISLLKKESVGYFIQVKPLNIYENELSSRLIAASKPMNYEENKYSGLANLLSFNKKSQKQPQKTEKENKSIAGDDLKRRTIVAKKRCTNLIEEASREVENQIKFDGQKAKTRTHQKQVQSKKD